MSQKRGCPHPRILDWVLKKQGSYSGKTGRITSSEKAGIAPGMVFTNAS